MNWPVAKAQHPEAAAKDLMGIIAAKWRTLSEDEKTAFKAQRGAGGGADVAVSEVVPLPGKSREGDVGTPQPSSSSGASHPVRHKNPYLAYCSLHREQVKAQHPDAKPSRLISLLAEGWRGLSDAERQAYRTLE